mmetsp:Transcript_36485/g.82058  ORF Transcript_36485/g.82058 Transcript_36485/m.82058 type:complete len:244 (-) Transcript_36485:1189-1920(-)
MVHDEVRVLMFCSNLDRHHSGLSVHCSRELRRTVQQTEHHSIIGTMLKGKMEIAAAVGILDLRCLGVLKHQIVHNALTARALDGQGQRHVTILVGTRCRRSKAGQHRLNGNLVHGLAIAEQQVQGQIPVLVGALGAREVFREQTGYDANAGVMTAGDVQREASPALLIGLVDNCVRALWGVGEQEFDRLGCVELGGHVDGLATVGIYVVDALFVGAVDDLQCRDVVVSCGMVQRRCADGILVQ